MIIAMFHADASYKLVGPLCIFAIWIIGYSMVRVWPGEQSMSLSQHAAAHKKSYVLFATSLSLTGIIFYVFCIKWLIPTFVPDKPGIMSQIHNLVAYGEAILLPIMLLILFRSTYLTTFARATAILAAGLELSYVIMFIGVKSLREHYLLYQSSYSVIFHIAILMSVFFGARG
jgi:hypothetical protein